MKFYSTFLICILTVSSHLTGQVLKSSAAQNLIPEAKEIRLNNQTRKIEFIEFDASKVKLIQEYEFSDFLVKTLNLSEAYRFIPKKEFVDKLGEKHIRYQQLINNIPIEGMEYIGHFKDEIPIKANGNYTNKTAQDVKTSITYTEAFEVAKRVVPSKQYIQNQNALTEKFELTYLLLNGSLNLCYKFDIYSIIPLDRRFVYVSASSGKVLKTISRIHDTDKTGVANTFYSGQQNITTDSTSAHYRLLEIGRADSIYTLNLNGSSAYSSALEITDNDNIWDSTDNHFNAGYDAHWGAEMTYDYFYNSFGRNSYDGNGAAILSYFNYGYNYNNAFWDGERMTYGQGDGTTYLPFTCLDIIAHEISHAVTQYSANLEYAYEPGALNESFSDIFGILVDFYANPGTANWLMADQISLTGTPIRNMSDPNSLFDPDTYQGNYWVTGSEDYGGVHTNSGVSNYWFYLLSEGGNGINDNGQSYNITGIGLDKAAEIVYRNLTVYLTQYSQFADARTYSIQAAIDLYGNCSQEVISVTNAWYAVGVGEPFNNAVIANFNLSQDFSCTFPVDITALNTSINTDSVKWYRNDVFAGSDSNLTLSYTSVGYYDIKLIAYGAANCGNSDTLEIDSAIYISDSGSPISAQCSPVSVYQVNDGITYFNLESIHKNSYSSYAGYEDFTCTNQTSLVAGKYYPFQINTIGVYGEVIYIWLDINNNGTFEPNEKLFESSPGSIHTGTVKIPAVSNYNTPLRLRIGSDRINYPLANACSQPIYGHYEDYTVFIEENTSAPVANFNASTQIAGSNEQITFYDLSENIPTSYHWSFDGGTPATSTLASPQVFYSVIGDYDVELVVTNQYGADTIIKANYISISDEYNMGDQDTSFAAHGKLYDSGGKDGNYSNGENNRFVINPPCADSIKLNFGLIYLETCCDRIRVYDGDISTGILLWTSSNNTIPKELVALSGSLTILFTSDGSVTSSGFEAYWETEFTSGLQAPIAIAHIEPDIPPFNTNVYFSDSSHNEPHTWQWNINNEFYSFEKNTKYKFKKSGEKAIELIVTNCHSSDTVQENISVQPAPEQLLGINNYSDTLQVGDSIIISIPVSNLSANGDLLVSITDTIVNEQPSTVKEYTMLFSGLNELDNNVSEYNFTGYFAQNEILNGKKILLPSQSGYSYLAQELISQGAIVEYLEYVATPILNDYNFIYIDDIFEAYVPTLDILNYISSGGNIIIAADNTITYYNTILANSGISFSSVDCYSGVTNNIFSHKVTEYITSYEIGPGVMGSLITTGNAIKLIEDQYNRIYSAISKIGNANVLVISNEAFYNSMTMLPGHIQLLNNYLSYCEGESGLLDVELSENHLYIEELTTDSLQIKIKTENAIGGLYNKYFNILSNDTAAESTIFPVNILVQGEAMASYDTNQIDFGLSYVNTQYTQSIILENVGTDSLFIDSIRFTNADFSAIDSAYRLPVGGAITYKINLVPSINKTYDDTLYVYSNSFEDSVHLIRLTAYSEYPPIISAVPDTIVEDMYTNDSVTYQVEISNTGTSELILGELFLETPASNSLILDKILTDIRILNYSSSISYQLFNRISSLGGIYSYSSYLTNELIDTVDVILLDANTYLSANEITILQEYINRGGGLLLADDYGQTSFNQIIQGSGLSFYDNGSCYTGLAPYIADHPITRDIDSVYIGFSSSVSSEIVVDSISYNNVKLVKDIANNVFAAAGIINHGRVVTIADRVLSYNSATNYDFELKCFEWLANKSEWIKIENFRSDTIQTGEISTFDVKLNATNLFTGIYQQNIIITNNDPANENFTIPVTINVTGIGIISLSDNDVIFDTTFTGYSSTDSIIIYNEGTEDLVITNITSDNTVFTSNKSTLSISPFSKGVLKLVYNPNISGDHIGTINIFSNAKDEPVTTVELKGVSILPPVLAVHPESIHIITNPDRTEEHNLEIDNNLGNSKLVYDLSITNTGTHTDDFLIGTLTKLNEEYQAVNSLIPGRFDFTNGTSGYYISDGGSDMFDGGNYLYTNSSYNYIYYSDNQISNFNNQGRYFTRKFDGLFVFVGELSNTTSFHVRGNLGASPANSDYRVIQRNFGQKTYKGFVARMYNYSRPSVNHLIIVEDNEGSYQDFSLSYDNYYHNIYGLDSSAVVHHLLFASQNGYYITDEEMEAIMDAYLDIVNPVPGWIAVNKNQGEIEQGNSEDLNLIITTNGLDFGTYNASIEVFSNDPENLHLSIPVVLEVVDNRPPEMISNLTDRVISLCQNNSLNLNNYIHDVDGDLLIYNIDNSNPDIIFPQIIDDSLFYFNPLKPGISTVELSISDGLNKALVINFDVLVSEDSKVTLLQGFNDMDVSIDETEIMIDLKDYFQDPDSDPLSYNVSFSREQLTSYELLGDYLVIQLESVGSTIVSISASDEKCGTLTESFILTIMGELDVNDSRADRFTLYPNPASDYILIENNNITKIDEITIFDTKGTSLPVITKTVADNQVSIDISGYEPGAYIIKCISQDQSNLLRFIKE